jgi:hypothetical protein
MRRIAVLFTVLLMVVSVQAYAGDKQQMPANSNMPANTNTKMPAKAEAPKSMTIQGEIVDMGCYISSGAKGKDHQGCAEMCLKNGMPMGLLTKDGTLYLLTVSHSNADPFNQAKQWASDQVVVTGPYSERNGIRAIEVDQVKMAPNEHASY